MSATAEAYVRASPAQAADPARRDRIVDHLVRCIEGAEVEDAPFQHMYLGHVFPANVGAEMTASVPERGATGH